MFVRAGEQPFPVSLALLVLFALGAASGCASWGASAASAEEYFSIGMAYYDMGKFEEAEKWLNRAKAKDKTQSASEYNLGRIAFERGRYEEAAKHFEAILKRDPENVMALKAAAYTRIKTKEIEKAEAHYRKLLELTPESADDGYNYALVLYAMEKYAETEQVLKGHEFALLDNSDVLLLYARAQKAQDKVEAIDTYAKWLANNTDPAIRYEYAQLLEEQELYARAIEEYRTAMSALVKDTADLKKADIHFSLARLLLVADSSSDEGVTELKGAFDDGFADFDAVEELHADKRISAANKDSIKTVVADAKRAAEAAKEDKQAAPGEDAAEAGTGDNAAEPKTEEKAATGGNDAKP